MHVTLNGIQEEFEKEMPLKDFLESKNIQASYLAVAVNCEFVPKSQYAQRFIKKGDDIEVVTPHPGG